MLRIKSESFFSSVASPYPPVPYPAALVYNFASGKSATVTIYIAANNRDINHFEKILEHVGSMPPP
jgi:hypothetical protein